MDMNHQFLHRRTTGKVVPRYLGSRATLEPLFASYGMPANSDYAPVLDLNAARHRFTERNATGMVEILNAGVPLHGRNLLPDDAVLVDLLLDWAPDEALRHRILVENPAALYGFTP